MDEAKRIVRYTLPGLVFALLLFTSILILDPGVVRDIFNKDGLNFGEILAVFLVTGCLGYVFSIVYFGVYWIFSIAGFHIFNHLSLVNILIASNKLRIVEPRTLNGKEVPFKPKGRRQAWHIINMYWHSRKKTSEAIMGVSEKLEPYYSDITSALGSTFFAAILSYITFYISVETYFDAFRHRILWCNVLYLTFIAAVLLNYINTFLSYQRLVNMTIAAEIFKEYEKNNYAPVKIVFYKST